MFQMNLHCYQKQTNYSMLLKSIAHTDTVTSSLNLLPVQPSKKFHIFLRFHSSKNAIPVIHLLHVITSVQLIFLQPKAQKSSSGLFGRPSQPTHKTVNNREATGSSLHYLLTQIHVVTSETLTSGVKKNVYKKHIYIRIEYTP